MNDIFLTHLNRSDLISKFRELKNLLNRDDPIIFEVGAHYGEDTIRFSKTFDNCKIYCFEPDPRNIKIFKKYIELDNASLHEYAISDEKKSNVKFYLSYERKADYSADYRKYFWIDKEDYDKLKLSASGSSSLKYNPRRSQDETYVEVTSLDIWNQDHNIDRVDLLWIDVQGAERGVINGAKNLLKATKFVFIEYGEMEYQGAMDKKSTIDLLNSHGFKLIKDNSQRAGDLIFKNISIQ